MAKKTKYGEETELISIRVPKSKKEEISNRFYGILNEYILGSEQNPFITENKAQEWAKEHKTVIKTQSESHEVEMSLDEIYECIEVFKGVPDVEYRSYVNPRKDSAFMDKNDVDVYYAYWGLRYYKFANKKEFDKFLKEKSIK